MSVAFRREDDDAHREPRFELPIPPGPNLVTPRGLALIEARVRKLEAAPADLGDEQREINARDLRYWRTRLATAIPAPEPAKGEAAIGTRVTFRLGGRERSVTLVGQDEADPEAGLIAFDAPLARALIGLGAGDLADFGGKAEAIELVAVAPI